MSVKVGGEEEQVEGLYQGGEEFDDLGMIKDGDERKDNGQLKAHGAAQGAAGGANRGDNVAPSQQQQQQQLQGQQQGQQESEGSSTSTFTDDRFRLTSVQPPRPNPRHTKGYRETPYEAKMRFVSGVVRTSRLLNYVPFLTLHSLTTFVLQSADVEKDRRHDPAKARVGDYRGSEEAALPCFALLLQCEGRG